jgi:hypothetical protein
VRILYKLFERYRLLIDSMREDRLLLDHSGHRQALTSRYPICTIGPGFDFPAQESHSHFSPL